jgi:outer membrane biosynthesis protein TonB
MAVLAAAVFGIVIGLWMLTGASTGSSDAEFILVPDTLPVQEAPADESDAEFILVPDTLPVQEPKAAPKAAPKRKARPAAPARPTPAVQEAPSAPAPTPAPTPAAAPSQEPAQGASAKVSLESVSLDEAVRRVKSKAGRGEARTSRGH